MVSSMPPQPQFRDPPHIQPAPAAFPEEEDGSSLRDLLGIALAGKWIIAAVTVLAGAIGGTHALLATPIYQAQAIVQVEGHGGGMLGFEGMTGMGAETTPARTEIEILRSRLVLGQVVEELNLQISVQPERFPVVGEFLARRHGGDEPAPPRLGAPGYAWGGETVQVDRLDVGERLKGQSFILVAGEPGHYELRGASDAPLLEGVVGELAEGEGVSIFVSQLVARPGTRFRVGKRSWLAAISSLRGGLSIREESLTGVIELRLEGADPDYLQKVLDGLLNTYVRQHVERRSAEARQSLEFLEQTLPELRAELEAAEEDFNAFRREEKAVDLAADTQHLLAQIVQVDAELAELELRRVEEGQRFTDQHPRMRTLADQRSRLRRSKAELEGRVGELPDRQQEALRLRREVEVAAELYTSLLNTSQELRVMQAGTVGNVRIVDGAVRPESPVKPQRTQIGAMSLALGLMLGVGVVFARHSLQRAVQSPDSLEQSLGLPVYTVIPHSRLEARAARRARRRGGPTPLLAKDHPQDVAVEGLRSFRTSLHFALLKSDERVIAVTSPHPSSGKSFVCMNAGFVFAETGKRVLVIDADLRRGYLHGYLDGARAQRRSPGLSDVLSGQCEASEAICAFGQSTDESGDHSTAGPGGAGGLDILTTGTLPPNPSELLMSAAFERLMGELSARYDLIIVDTPPILAVTDAAVVGSHAAAMFLLVRAGLSQVQEIEAALKRLRQNEIPVTGLLFNDLGARAGGATGYGYSYYQYRYTTRDKRA